MFLKEPCTQVQGLGTVAIRVGSGAADASELSPRSAWHPRIGCITTPEPPPLLPRLPLLLHPSTTTTLHPPSPSAFSLCSLFLSSLPPSPASATLFHRADDKDCWAAAECFVRLWVSCPWCEEWQVVQNTTRCQGGMPSGTLSFRWGCARSLVTFTTSSLPLLCMLCVLGSLGSAHTESKSKSETPNCNTTHHFESVKALHCDAAPALSVMTGVGR